MPRGGYRVGAGRPKGSRSRVTLEIPGLSPLAIHVDRLNDPAADAARRDKMAVAAAPYVHARAMLAAEDEPPKGVKAQREAEAKQHGRRVSGDAGTAEIGPAFPGPEEAGIIK